MNYLEGNVLDMQRGKKKKPTTFRAMEWSKQIAK